MCDNKYSVNSKPKYHNVVNLSSYVLTEPELELLNKGLSFIPTPHSRRYDPETLVGDFRSLCNTHMARYKCLIPRGSDKTLQRVCTDIRTTLSLCQVCKCKPNLSPTLREALKNLKSNKRIVVSKADKGDVAVVLDVNTYTRLAWKHLSDTNTYVRIECDPTSEIVDRFNAYLAQCAKDRVIDKYLWARLKLPLDTEAQTIYFLPKIHKVPLKFRPIVSCTNGPTQLASAYIDRLLQPHARQVRSFVLNSTAVVNTLREMTFPEDVLLATLDIESLYTNITHQQAIHAFMRRFSAHPRRVFLLDLLKFVLTNNVFQFDGLFFKQTCGLAMGTKLAPALATIVVGDLEEAFLVECEKQPLLWLRYIDDVLCLWPHSEADFLDFVNALNQLAPRLKFTHTISAVGISFLDIYIYKGVDFAVTHKLSTRIHYKPTNTFSYPLGTSFWSSNVTKGIAVGELVRILRNTCSQTLFSKYKQKLLRHLRHRQYPRRAIDAAQDLDFGDRDRLLRAHTRENKIDKPLPLNTLFYRFTNPLNPLLTREWSKLRVDPFLPLVYPTAPFTAFKNHFTLGKRLSRKRDQFGGPPEDSNICKVPPSHFTMQRFNRPRTKADLANARKSIVEQPTALVDRDQTCGNSRCTVCPRLSHAPFITSRHTKTSFPVNHSLHCRSKGIIYVLECRLCGKQYVGQTERDMRYRFAAHRSKLTRAPMSLYSHFIRYHACHSLNVTIYLVEQVADTKDRLQAERHWIGKLATSLPWGLNNPTPTHITDHLNPKP